MTATAPLKKSPSMKEWTAQADPPKEASTVKKVNVRHTNLKNGLLQVVL